MGLSARDKSKNESGYGMKFHPTDPQRYIPTWFGRMLAPRSADDIPPITPEAMASVQAALTLLANFVADRDHALSFAHTDIEVCRAKARDILSVARGLAGILRVEPVCPDCQRIANADGDLPPACTPCGVHGGTGDPT
jgi:hypothetical protein